MYHFGTSDQRRRHATNVMFPFTPGMMLPSPPGQHHNVALEGGIPFL